MRVRMMGIFLAVAMAGAAQVVNAAPERIAIKKPEQAAKQRAAQAQIKAIDLEDIEDPAAKRAIQEIFNYLGLQARK